MDKRSDKARNKKEDILEAWIMVEHLSEGDINIKDKNILTFDALQDEDYFGLFEKEIQRTRMKNPQRGGIVLYFDIFPFQEIVEFLRKTYSLPVPEEEIAYGQKFAFALYFDNQLKLNGEMTFLTESYYIRKHQNVPSEEEFVLFEEEHKKRIEEIFRCPEDDEENAQAGDNEKAEGDESAKPVEQVDYRVRFNQAMQSLLQGKDLDGMVIKIQNCRMQVVQNLETDAANLHSFFTKDLEKAKKISTSALDAYLLGSANERVDLDSRIQSSKFNGAALEEILWPQNYPAGRFPGNPKHALALMQQTAVNLATGYDNEQIRSVNGPPGTGKTTLLRDVFAEQVVQQARQITELPDKEIRGSEKTKYWQNAAIGEMPDHIAELGIVVASSNNGAVQNIVNELPLTKEVDDTFRAELLAADYFKEIANTKLKATWVTGEDGKSHEVLTREPNEEPDKLWGLFSLEGGKKENMTYIMTVLKHVAADLDQNYEPNEEIYEEFAAAYRDVETYKKKRQTESQQIKVYEQLEDQISIMTKAFEGEKSDRRKKLDKQIFLSVEEIKQAQAEIDTLAACVCGHQEEEKRLREEEGSIEQCMAALLLQKPGFFAPRAVKNEFKQKRSDYAEELEQVILAERSVRTQIDSAEKQSKKLQNEIAAKQSKLRQAQEAYAAWNEKQNAELAQIQSEARALRQEIASLDLSPLDFHVDYETLQLSNPWFGEEYRNLQSKLFIMALRVRKQFLYENRKHIKAAYRIWSKPKEHTDNKQVIAEAWNWMNMVIPVIGSTFASFGRMCANMHAETIGHLFIDEAGQALPQAGVGAIFRSRHVMAVGDPAQIKPVLTLDTAVLHMLGSNFGVSAKYLSEDASVQTLIDTAGRYGFYKDDVKEDWIGIPLWVHRRCRYPMFDIANKISYGGNMVQGIKQNGRAAWYDVSGAARDKYVVEQGEFLVRKIQEMAKQNPQILNRQSKDVIYVITPFRNVAFQLAQKLKEIGFTRYDKKGKPTNVGTVHTFQGKEAPIVFLVLGADEKSKGAANWAMGSQDPSIMNVAATRAKEEFYIIGSKALYQSLNSDVINHTAAIIRRFNAAQERCGR